MRTLNDQFSLDRSCHETGKSTKFVQGVYHISKGLVYVIMNQICRGSCCMVQSCGVCSELFNSSDQDPCEALNEQITCSYGCQVNNNGQGECFCKAGQTVNPDGSCSGRCHFFPSVIHWYHLHVNQIF